MTLYCFAVFVVPFAFGSDHSFLVKACFLTSLQSTTYFSYAVCTWSLNNFFEKMRKMSNTDICLNQSMLIP